MRFWHSLVSIFFVTVVLLMGLCGISASCPVVWEIAVEKLSLIRLALVVSGSLVWAFAVLYVMTGRKRRRNTRYLSFDNVGGTVSISTDAISDYVAKLVSEFPSIVHMRPQIIPAKNSMDILIKVSVKAGSQVSEACEALQSRVRETIGVGLGIEQVGKVEVSVEKIVSEHKPE